MPPPAWCAYGGSCARAPTPWQIGCDRLAGVAQASDSRARISPVELGQAVAGRKGRSRSRVVHSHQLLLELGVARRQLARHEVLRVVAPVAVGADPDLEERRLVLGDRTAAGRGEGPDPRAGPDEREAVRELDLALVAGAVRRAPSRSTSRRPRSRSSPAGCGLDVLHRGRRDLVREPHPLDLLLRLDRARLREQRRRVGRVRERVEPRLRCTSSARRPCGPRPACRATAPARPVVVGRRSGARGRARAARAAGGRSRRSRRRDGCRPSTPSARRRPATPRGRSGPDRPRAGRRRRRSPSSPRSSSGRGRCPARGRRARRALARPSARARARASRRRAASSRRSRTIVFQKHKPPYARPKGSSCGLNRANELVF